MKQRQGGKKDYKSYLGILSMIVFATVIIIASTLTFSFTAQKAMDKTTDSLGKFYLEEIASRTVYEIETELDRSVMQAQKTAGGIREESFASDEALRAYLAATQSENGYDVFAVLDERGTVYTAEDTISAALTESVTETAIYTLKREASKVTVLISVPTARFSFGERSIVGCLVGTDIDKIMTAQRLQGMNDQVVCRLFNGDDGTCLVESEGRYADGSSIFDVWRNDCSFSGEYSSEKMISDWNARTAGYAYYTAKEGSTYLFYKPVSDTNWMVSVRLRENVIGTQIKESGSITVVAGQVQLVVVIVSMVAVFFLVIRQIRKGQEMRFAKEKEDELLRQEAKASEEKLRLQEKLLNEEKTSSRQNSVLQILSKEYSSVYYVDLENDTAVPLRLSDAASQIYKLERDQTYSFREVYEKYIRGFAVAEQTEELLRFSDPEYLRRQLKDDENLTYLYRIVREGKELYAQLRVARVENEAEFSHVVLGFAIVDDAVRAEQENQRAIKEALAQAEQASRAKTAFLNNMSHDIRTPMNAIIGYTNIALKQNPSPEVKDCLEKISDSSDHLLTLINDVLDISRIESGKIRLNPAPVDLTSVTDVVLDIMHGFLSNRNITFHIKRANRSHTYVFADVVRIREVLVNILGNAVKFTDDGGSIDFVTQCREGSDEKHIVVTYLVSDTGIGMSKDFLNHIFDEFSQETASARTKYKGAGLGMAITKRYVELMGGTITVQSEKGKGSTFVVELPMELADESMVENPDLPIANVRLKGVKILLAEDNALNAEIATIQLEEIGATIVRAADGTEAVKIFSENPPYAFDVILMDIMMPNMNGYEAAKAIRAMTDRSDAKTVPIIAMTANAFVEDVQNSLSAGMNAHIAKPIVIDEVAKTIARNLNR